MKVDSALKNLDGWRFETAEASHFDLGIKDMARLIYSREDDGRRAVVITPMPLRKQEIVGALHRLEIERPA